MHPCWQILERHQNVFRDLTMLWVDPPESNSLIKDRDQTVSLNRQVYNSSGTSALEPNQSWPEQTKGIVLFYPKAKERLIWWLNQLFDFRQQNPECQLWVVGENNGGIKSLPKRVTEWAATEKCDSARHCVLHKLHANGRIPEPPVWSEFEFLGQTVAVAPGVFSQHRIDQGSAMLIDALPTVKGRCLDFGCGSGVISLSLLQRNPEVNITAVDIDWLAVRSAEHNLSQCADVNRYSVIWSNGLEQLARRRFKAIITNPPFHQGIRTHYEATEDLFRSCADWLVSGGALWWVANEFLDYQSYLPETVGMVEEMAHGRGFKVFRARRM